MEYASSTMENPAAPRLSGKAAVAGTLALLSLSACLVMLLLVTFGVLSAFGAILVMPLLGVSACVIGFFALRDIKNSQGRLKGRVPALIGVFLGLLTATIQGAAGIGALRTYMDLRNTLAPAMGRLFIALDRGEPATAALYLSKSTQAPTQETLARVTGELRARLGACRGAEFDLEVLKLASDLARSGTPTQSPTPVDLPRSVRLIYEKGHVLLLVWLDNPALDQNEVRLIDGILMLPAAQGATGGAAGEIVLLRSDGPAATVAQSFGLKQAAPSVP